MGVIDTVFFWSGVALIWLTAVIVGWAYMSEIAVNVASTEEGVQQVLGLYVIFVMGLTLLGLGLYL